MDISKYLSDNGRILYFSDSFNQPLAIDGIWCKHTQVINYLDG